MEIIQMKIADVIPYERNPRINENAIEAVAASIKEFGWRAPIVVDENHVIICGHTRLLAAKHLGLDTVPVHIAKGLTPEQVKAYRIADNKTSEIAEWDYDLLPLELADLQQADFDLSLLGFDADELDKLLNGEDAVAEGMTDPDEVPEPPEEPVSKRGEIYQLGNHRLMCGDSTDNANVEALMLGEKANLLLQDPPYNVAYEGGTAEHLTIQNDNMDDAAFSNFLTDAFKCAVEVMKPGAAYYIFHADSEGYNFRGACKAAGLQVRQCLVWKKDSLVLGRQDYLWIHEPILYGWKDGAAHNWYSDRKQTTVLEFDRPKRSELHPTTKPVEMLVYLIKNSSQRGELVADFFGGSGSTLIAAEQIGSKAYLMELDEKYCDVIRKRWAEFTHGEGCDWQALTPKIQGETGNE
jgi:site-specific DNA-methyltransferase (adenine-specific)